MLDEGDALFVHAEPIRPAEWGYIFDLADAQTALAATEQRFCFVGHSHIPFLCAEEGGDVARVDAGPVRSRARYLANVGSVGQPRDGDPRACFALWDRAAGTLELVRCPYAVAAAQDKIIAAGLPSFLAERLARGQ